MLSDSRKKSIELIKNNKFVRFLLSIGLYGFMFTESLFDPDLMKDITSREERTGLLKGTILQNPLWFPNEDNLEFEEEKSGVWTSYDFNRPKEFNNPMQKRKGTLYYFPLPEIIENSGDILTPTGYLNIFNIYQLLHIDNAPMGELERLEMVIESTYEKSFREVGEYEKYAKIISELGIGEKKVYQVTPKGNGLIAIVEKTGSKKLKENHQKDVFGDFIPKPAFAY